MQNPRLPAGTLAAIAFVSCVVNLLALTAPLFMLQVYDRVLSSRSMSTLLALSILAACLYLFQAGLDILRARVLLRLGEHFDNQFSRRIHHAIVTVPLIAKLSGDGLQPLRDLDNTRSFLAGAGPTAFFDLPWVPLYLAICFVFHFWLGVTALVGAIVLVALTLLNNFLSREPVRALTEHNIVRNTLMGAGRRNAEVVRAMGLEKRIAEHWQDANRATSLPIEG